MTGQCRLHQVVRWSLLQKQIIPKWLRKLPRPLLRFRRIAFDIFRFVQKVWLSKPLGFKLYQFIPTQYVYELLPLRSKSLLRTQPWSLAKKWCKTIFPKKHGSGKSHQLPKRCANEEFCISPNRGSYTWFRSKDSYLEPQLHMLCTASCNAPLKNH